MIESTELSICIIWRPVSLFNSLVVYLFVLQSLDFVPLGFISWIPPVKFQSRWLKGHNIMGGTLNNSQKILSLPLPLTGHVILGNASISGHLCLSVKRRYLPIWQSCFVNQIRKWNTLGILIVLAKQVVEKCWSDKNHPSS